MAPRGFWEAKLTAFKVCEQNEQRLGGGASSEKRLYVREQEKNKADEV